MKNIKIIITNYYHYIILTIYFLLLVYQHSFIGLYGDDFYYGTFLDENFINKHIDHYMYINGRALVHIIVTLIIHFKTKLFMIINPLMIVTLISLIARLSTNDHKEYKYSIIANIILFSMLNINITRQSVFWLDGSFNYVFPMLLTFACLYFFKKNLYQETRVFFLPILGIMASMTTEQASLINIGGILLILLSSKYIHNYSPRLIHYLTLLLSFLASLTIFLSPGTFARMKVDGTDFSIIENVKSIIEILFFSKSMQVFNLLLLMCISLYLLFACKKIFINKLLIISNTIFIFLLLGVNYFTQTNYVLMLLLVIAFIFSLFYMGFLYLTQEKNEIIIISFVLALGAQLMMIVSPVYGYRILLCTILLYFIPITISLNKFRDKRHFWPSLVLILSIYSSNRYFIFLSILLIAMDITYHYIIQSKRLISLSKSLIGILIVAITLNCIWNNIEGYKINYTVYKSNESSIQQFVKSRSKDNTLVLKKMPLYDYGWSYPYVSTYHLKVMKQYYGISSDVEINFISE